ncbi:MAG TPA: type II toxin-antitoxin system HicB family antitoxin [Bacteroidota bacterium]|jgi:predicted RNase H-like HicB family nuclease|nr:type II toxin-antitoxin system HicB family antitoxin [Bacteroidota bacterium]
MKKVKSKLRKRDNNNHGRNGRSLRILIQLPYKIELIPLSKKDGGGYFATIPLLKGCQSDGSTPDEAIKNLREAQKAWLASALKHGDPIPVPQ